MSSTIRAGRTNKAGRTEGFTLLELLVVLVILVLIVGVTVPFLAPDRRGRADLKATTLELAAGLRRTRARAIRFNREAVFVLNMSDRAYKLALDGASVALPDDLDFSLVTAASEKIDASTGGIRFFADGSSTGGGVTVSGRKGKFKVTVDWLSGRVRIDE